MTGDYSRWLATETTATLAHDIPRPADPWANIPNADDEYAGTELELRPSTVTEPGKG